MKKKTKLFWIVTVATLAWIVVMRQNSPPNIIQFELARTIQTAQEIISDWGPDGIILAQRSTYLDFVFLILYCWAISLGCRVASNFSTIQLIEKSGSILSKTIWLAALCDAIENIAMLQTLQTINQATITIAFYFAVVKFAIVLICLAFVVIATAVGKMVRFKRSGSV